jgi:hypothetical protein
MKIIETSREVGYLVGKATSTRGLTYWFMSKRGRVLACDRLVQGYDAADGLQLWKDVPTPTALKSAVRRLARRASAGRKN